MGDKSPKDKQKQQAQKDQKSTAAGKDKQRRVDLGREARAGAPLKKK